MNDRRNWAELAVQAAGDGDLEAAKRCFAKAVKVDKNDPILRFHYGVVLERLADFGAAAEQFTEVLRIEPTATDAARRLGRLVNQGALPASVQLNPLGLKAALTHHDFVNRDHIAEATAYYLSRKEPLRSDLELGRTAGWDDAARRLCLKKTGSLLRDDLFLLVLRDSVIRMPDLEQLLTAVRKVLLLELPSDRFDDRTLASLLSSLMRQCWVNEYVWAVTPQETDALALHRRVPEGLFQGDPSAGINFAIAALYQPASALLGDIANEDSVARIRPQIIREAVSEHIQQVSEERSLLAKIPRLGTISDPTSKRVQNQYSQYPYPRWRSLDFLLRPGEWREMLGSFFPPEKLQFMDGPFEVLIAGCGTGKHAIAEAHAYGPNARITAIDISLPSLAYAVREAEHYCASGIRFVQGDIIGLAKSSEFASRFHVIECVGVLHHTANPFQNWRELTGCLVDDGLMLIGLYSALARRSLAKLREEPSYPGPGCDDDRLRAYRQNLLRRDLDSASDFKGIRDIYTTSGFRDLLLHECEHNFTLPQISRFLDETGLVFRGFLDTEAFERMRESFADEVWPGKLMTWAQLEERNPQMFIGMYKFWCDRRHEGLDT